MKEGIQKLSVIFFFRWLCNYVLVRWFDLRRNDEDEYDDDDDESDNGHELI